jgi:DNA-binding response OmpR family regulator
MKQTVLICDDDVQFVTFLDRTLKRGGFSVITVSDGCEVPEIIQRTAVDILLLDLQMPGMNGWEVLRSLKEVTAWPGNRARPKVIVISGRNEDETVSFVRRLGADAYLMKPLWGDEILATVRSVLGNGH